MKRLVKIALVALVIISLNSCIGCRLSKDIPQECPEQSEVKYGEESRAISKGNI